MKKIGYVGLGAMGYGMASNLIEKCGMPVYGYDLVDELCKRFKNKGGYLVSDACELYKMCDVIFICLPTNEIVRSTVTEIIDVAKPGTIVIDMGSTSPYVIQDLNRKAQKKGIYFLDAPVSGGQIGAETGTLVIMVGGEKNIFDKVLPYMEMLGKTVTYMGGSGYGSIAKIANNMMVGIHLAAMGEAFAFAKKAGIDPAALFHTIQGGFAQSAVMNTKMPKILNRDFSASARIAVHLKDIDNAMSVAEHLNVELPMTRMVKEQMDWIKEHEMVNEDQCALIKYYENNMDVVV